MNGLDTLFKCAQFYDAEFKCSYAITDASFFLDLILEALAQNGLLNRNPDQVSDTVRVHCHSFSIFVTAFYSCSFPSSVPS